jgi:hypothetical protein
MLVAKSYSDLLPGYTKKCKNFAAFLFHSSIISHVITKLIHQARRQQMVACPVIVCFAPKV